MSMEIRPAREADLASMVALYNPYVSATPITFDTAPFTVESRRPWLEQFAGGRHRLLVAVEDGRLLGYAGSMRFRSKPAYETSVETTLYVQPDLHRRRIGSSLYEALFAALRGEDVHRALAGITLPNTASVALHERFGFVKVAHFTEQGRKLGKYWDVGWWEKAISSGKS